MRRQRVLVSLILILAGAGMIGSATATAAEDDKARAARAHEHVAAAKEHFAKGEYLAAIDSCYFATLEKQDSFDAHYQRGLAYLARHEYDKAIRTFDRALQIDPKSALSLSHRGAAHGGLGRFDACIADQEKALELDASLALAYARRGAARVAKSDPAKARQDIDKALSLDPTLGEALCDRAVLKAAKGDLRAAAADADAAIKAEPRLARGHFERGVLWMRQGNGAAAASFLAEAIRLDPRDSDALVARGQLQLAAKKYEPARADFTAAIALSPKLAIAYAARAEANKRLRDMTAAKADLEMAKSLQPADPKTKQRAVTKSDLPPRFELLSAAVDPARHAAAITAAKKIDALVAANYSQHKVAPMPRTDDAQFVRRIYLDIAGRIPTYKEVNAFLHAREPDKRTRLIDELLGSDDYALHFYNYWADVFRYRDTLGNDVRGEPWRQWVKQSLAENKPWDDMVREMLTAEGLSWENPATGYLQRDPGMPLDVVNNTVRIFLGTRIGCAQCHNHPFDSWTQRQFYEAAAFMFGTGTRVGGGDKRFFQEDPVKRLRAEFAALEQEEEERRQRSYPFDRHVTVNMMVVHDNVAKKLTLPANYAYDDAKPGAAVEPQPLFGPDLRPEPGETPRQSFARWLTSPDNPRFALTIANRLWKQAFGAGQIEPEDDMTAATVAENPALMQALEQLIRDLDFDMKEFLRIIYNTETYQRQAYDGEVAAGMPYHFPGPLLRRMTAEQAWDSILTLAVFPVEYREPPATLYADAVAVDLERHSAEDVIESQQKVAEFDRLRRDMQKPYTYKGNLLARASELPSPLPPNHFLRMFGQSDRELIQASSTWGSVPQVLFMFNGQISHMLLEKNSTIYNTIARKKTVKDGVEAVFLTILARAPTEEEMAAAIKEVKVGGPAGYGNVVWSLINTREFLFIQ
jgi:tetratricopeptide (TPR) repeat protein